MTLDPLELELQVVLNHLVGAWKRASVSMTASHLLSTKCHYIPVSSYSVESHNCHLQILCTAVSKYTLYC